MESCCRRRSAAARAAVCNVRYGAKTAKLSFKPGETIHLNADLSFPPIRRRPIDFWPMLGGAGFQPLFSGLFPAPGILGPPFTAGVGDHRPGEPRLVYGASRCSPSAVSVGIAKRSRRSTIYPPTLLALSVSDRRRTKPVRFPLNRYGSRKDFSGKRSLFARNGEPSCGQ